MGNETKFLVNGKAMTNKEYVELLTSVRNATKAFRETPEYKKQQEAKAQAEEELKANVDKFVSLAKSLKVSDEGLAKISLVLYHRFRTRKE